MAFNASHMSKFSEYSVKKSREEDYKPNVNVNIGGGLLKQ